MSESLKLRAQMDYSRGGLSIWGFIDYPQGKPRSVVINLMMEQRSDEEIMHPFVTVERHSAQLLLDDLWNAGFRPTEGTTTTEHLGDLRTIAFAALKKIGLPL